MNAEYTIGLSSWIIQDGNYGEFARGDVTAFAVEFWSSNGLSAAKSGSTAAPTLIP